MSELSRLEEEHRRFMQSVREAIQSGNTEVLKQRALKCRMIDYETGVYRFSRDVFAFIAELLREPKFLVMQGSHHVLFILSREHDALESGQREALPKLFGEAMDKISDPMAPLIMADILGRYVQTKEAFEVLNRALSSRNEVVRSAAVAGLNSFSSDTELGRSAAVVVARTIDKMKRLGSAQSKSGTK